MQQIDEVNQNQLNLEKSRITTHNMANNALHLSEDKLNDLKEDTDYWTNKVRQQLH